MKKNLPVGLDDFKKLRSNPKYYYVDKSLIIKDFIEYEDETTLITRPRRFGKTLNMTMIRDFFDITQNSADLFQGLQIMETTYASQINSRPVIYFSYKDCAGHTAEDLRQSLIKELLKEYDRYAIIFHEIVDMTDTYIYTFFSNFGKLKDNSATLSELRFYLQELIHVVSEYYAILPILLIDEYDQPILSSYEHHYRNDLKDFFTVFYGSALKSNRYLGKALLTGIQLVAKESIFSQLNNINVYTILDEQYSPYFGLTTSETADLLETFQLSLTHDVKQMYNGYLFHTFEMYNPWSILNYAKRKVLDHYWVNTSTNYLVRTALKEADPFFKQEYHELIEKGSVEVGLKLDTSFIELNNSYTLWGLLVNAGYLTIIKNEDTLLKWIKIPNGEVKAEFISIISEEANMNASDLERMFRYLRAQDMDNFMKIYRYIVQCCTSFHDAKEYAYHMLFLGMCISLQSLYKVSSNLESEYGRYDICLEAHSNEQTHILIAFKQGDDIEKLKKAALQQILDKKYYSGLNGKILCIGIAHNIKYCDMDWLIIEN